MRFYESLSYLNNNTNQSNGNNNSNYQHHASQNIDRTINTLQALNSDCSAVQTVKTFTSNGNHQSDSDSDGILESIEAANTQNSYFELNESNDGVALSSQQNWQLETDFGKSLAAAFNETYCFYGSHRTLKSRENLDLNDEDNANGNVDKNGDDLNEFGRARDAIDLIDGTSSDIEAELNHLINRSNLCRQNFECESNKELTAVTHTDDQLMDEEEEFSSLSFSASLSVENKPSYPRGIINPNYPGFQHLAHTLTEQFVDPHSNQTESMSDSDFSEVDSDFPSEGHSAAENNNIHSSNDDSNGNKIVETDTAKPITDNLNTVEEILRTVFESNSNHLSSVIEMFSEKEAAVNKQAEIDAIEYMNDVNACDLETYLEHYEDGGIHIENVKPWMKTKEAPVPIIIEPDVIRKSSSCECGFDNQTPDKPDILLDVTEDGSAALGTGEKEEPGSTWSITPVDIVGNFEQEVERELGLLKLGYRNTAFNDDCDSIDGQLSASPGKLADGKFLHKTADAALSSANDIISVSADQKVLNANETMQKNQIPTAIVKPKYQKSSFDERQLPTVAHMNEDKMAWYEKLNMNTGTGNDSVSSKVASVEASTQSKKIHLPEFDRKAKKHIKSMPIETTMSSPTAAANKLSIAKSAHNITAETAAHTNQCMKTGNMESGASDRKESVSGAVVHRRSVDKKSVKTASSSSGTKLAVVQPRKKERMDQAKLMETILQMQIKKNARLYRNQGNNDKSNTMITATTQMEKLQANHSNNNNNNSSSGNTLAKYFNNNNTTNNHSNNNNGENRMNTERNQTKKDQKENSGCFDVYNIETALPAIDLETIENHLKLKKEDERRKRNDREEIRRRLAMGAEDDYLTKISTTKPGRKPSLQSRLQEGKNLQICFVNDAAAAADLDSLSSDSESCPKLSKPIIQTNQSTNSLIRLTNTNAIQPNPYNSRPLSMKKSTPQEKNRSSALTLDALKTDEDPKEIDFFTKQARLQIEARMALAQAKDIAHMQMEMERQKQMESPITGMIRSTIEKVGYHFPAEKRRVSRQMLTDMNVAQLQIIVNDFHTQIEGLNEQLVKYLMDRDDLHMSQDSMLVDIEDLTRYLGAKKDPYSTDRKKTTKKYHSMKSPKYMVSQKNNQPQHRLASQIGKS